MKGFSRQEAWVSSVLYSNIYDNHILIGKGCLIFLKRQNHKKAKL